VARPTVLQTVQEIPASDSYTSTNQYFTSISLRSYASVIGQPQQLGRNDIAMANTAKKSTRNKQPDGTKGRAGAPQGNKNAMTHGLSSSRTGMRYGLKAGQLPKDCRYIENRVNRLRRSLEDAVVAARSEVSLTDAANIQTAVKWERHGCLAQRWLTKKANELKPMELLQFSRETAKASTERDRAIAALDLDRDDLQDAFKTLYVEQGDNNESS
jgi:hypothetical protein